MSSMAHPKTTTLWCCTAFAVFLALCGLLTEFAPRDAALEAQYNAEVPPFAYLAPALAFTTAFLLNAMTLAVERQTPKMQLSMIVCYINLLAALTDYLGYLGVRPILRDPWGQGFNVLRVSMWLLTTPAMVYLLGLISDMTQQEVMSVVTTDALMIAFLIVALLQQSQLVAVLLIGCAMGLYVYTIRGVSHMFDAPLSSMDKRDTGWWSLQMVRGLTVTMWTTFIAVFMVTKLRLVSLATEEILWGLVDFLGKVMFSSSLLQSNFITMEQRRVLAMKLVEESRREQFIQELTSLVQQKEHFMSSMSHELRTPLNGIIGLSDALLIGCCGELTDVSMRTICTIKSSGLRLLNLINDILDAASMQHGKLVLRQEKVKLDRLVDDAMDLLKPLARKEVRLINSIPSTLPCIVGDTGRVMQVMHNLIGNACKFTNSGTITVQAILKMDEVEVAVADTGIGIPKEKFNSIFKAFEQVDMSTTRQYGGTGLGLTLVKQLVEAHGGRIAVKSKVGLGTTFYFTLKVWDTELHEEANKEMSATDLEATKQRVIKMMSILQKGTAKTPSVAVRTPTDEGAASAAEATLAARGAEPAQGTGEAAAAAAAMAEPEQPRSPPPGPATAADAPTEGSGSQGMPLAASGVNTPRQAAERTPNVLAQAAQGALSAGRAPTSGGETESGSAESAAALPVPGLKVKTPVGESGLKKTLSWRPDDMPSKAAATAAPAAAAATATPARRMVTGEDDLGSIGDGHPVLVLSVDDDPVNQLVIQSWLAPKGYEIIKAMDGQEALEYLGSGKQVPDVILLDVMMPGMSGHEVCRKLRELYPESCVPVIMISAKSQEEDIVEGLAVGATDYIVKPLKQKELEARIRAHLRYRTKMMNVAASESAMESHRRSQGAESLVELLCVASKAFSLPASIKSKVENSTGVSTPLQVFNDLTMVVIGITNLEALTASRTLTLPEVLGGLASLYIYLEDLLVQHNAYLVDCLEDKLVIVTGLSGDIVDEQVKNAVGLAAELQRIATSVLPGPGSSKLMLSAGVHCCTATAVIVGVQHPVLQVTGALADRASQLQATSPPGCIHVSKRVYDVSDQPDSFSPAASAHGLGVMWDATYLHHSGPWKAHLATMPQRFERYMAVHPFGPINSTCLRLRPVQRAMLSILQSDIKRLIEFLHLAARKASTRDELDSKPSVLLEDLLGASDSSAAGDRSSAHGPSTRPSPAGSVAHPAPTPSQDLITSKQLKLVTKLQLEKEELVRQLEQKTSETDRLQVVIDNLQLDLYGLEGMQSELRVLGEEKERLKTQVATLQAQVLITASKLRAQEGHQPPARSGSLRTLGSSTRAVSGRQSGQAGSSVPASNTLLTPFISGVLLADQQSVSTAGISRTSGEAMRDETAETGTPDAEADAGHPPSISEFLTSIGMSHLIPAFTEEEISADMIPLIGDQTLLQLGVTSVGDMVRLRRACSGLDN